MQLLEKFLHLSNYFDMVNFTVSLSETFVGLCPGTSAISKSLLRY